MSQDFKDADNPRASFLNTPNLRRLMSTSTLGPKLKVPCPQTFSWINAK